MNPHENRMYVPQEQKQKYWDELTKPVVCRSLTDIQMAIVPFLEDNDSKSITISCDVDGEKVSSKSESASYRKLLLDGLSVIKNRIDAIETMKDAVRKAGETGDISNLQIWEVDKIRFNVDGIIERKLGGKRNGICIRWKLENGSYEYEPFTNKLYEIEK